MSWLDDIQVSYANYMDYDHQWGPKCRECYHPLQWLIKDLTDEEIGQPIVCVCGSIADCELCEKPLLWKRAVRGSSEDIAITGGRDFVISNRITTWWECEDGHPSGQPPKPALFARSLYEDSVRMSELPDYDWLEAEKLLERSIDIYARVGLTIAAIELSMKLAIWVFSRAENKEEYDYSAKLMEFALGELGKPGYEERKKEASATFSILNAYISACHAGKTGDVKGVENGLSLMVDQYNIAKDLGYTGSIGAAEEHLPTVLKIRESFGLP